MQEKSIERYIENASEKGKVSLAAFIAFMKEIIARNPEVVFSMPMWKKGKKMSEGYVAISVAKNYYTIHFSDEALVEKIAKEKKYKCGKRCVNIPYGNSEGDLYIRDIVKAFVKEW